MNIEEAFAELGAAEQPEVRELVENTREALILDPKDPMPSARKFVEREHSVAKLVQRCGDFFVFDGVCYRPRSDLEMRSAVWSFLDKAWRVQGKKLVRFQPNRSRVGDVVDALRALAQIEERHEPLRLDRRRA